MTEQNSNHLPENAPEAQPVIDVIECDDQTVFEPAQANGETEVFETVIDEQAPEGEEAADKTPQTPSEPWYRKITRSAGATAGVAVGALLVVGLVAGVSAFAGAQAASSHGHAKSMLEQRAIPEAPEADDTTGTPDRGYGSTFDDDFDSNRGNGGWDDNRFKDEGKADGIDAYGYGRGHSRGYGLDGSTQDENGDGMNGNRGNRSFGGQGDSADSADAPGVPNAPSDRGENTSNERPQMPEAGEATA